MSALKKTVVEGQFEAANDCSYGAVVKGAVGVALVTLAQLSHAAAMAVPVELTDAGLSVVVIGLAVFGISVGIKLYKWVSRAL